MQGRRRLDRGGDQEEDPRRGPPVFDLEPGRSKLPVPAHPTRRRRGGRVRGRQARTRAPGDRGPFVLLAAIGRILVWRGPRSLLARSAPLRQGVQVRAEAGGQQAHLAGSALLLRRLQVHHRVQALEGVLREVGDQGRAVRERKEADKAPAGLAGARGAGPGV